MQRPFGKLIFVLAALCALPGFAGEPKDSDWDGDWHWRSHSDFAWQVQANLPARDLGRALDNRTGLGLGMQWTTNRSHGAANRTRLEWNVFSESNPVGDVALKTKATNIVFSFDRLYHFSGEAKGLYVLGGLGAVRWNVDQTPGANPTHSMHTTKLAVTAGAGYRFNRSVAAETRYMVSSIQKAYDGNVAQAGISIRF